MVGIGGVFGFLTCVSFMVFYFFFFVVDVKFIFNSFFMVVVGSVVVAV